MQKFKVNGQLVLKIEWKQRMDKRTDGRTGGGDCITSLANVVSSKGSSHAEQNSVGSINFINQLRNAEFSI